MYVVRHVEEYHSSRVYTNEK